jgi:3-oxoacyl-[acyl-carrier protein] reductase
LKILSIFSGRHEIIKREVMEMDGKVALITGGSAGLGKMAAIELGKVGYKLALNSRTDSVHSARLVQNLRAEEVEVIRVFGDVSQRAEAEEVVSKTVAHFGRIDVLVHAVGPFIRQRKWFVEHSAAEIEEMVAGNLLSAMWVTKAILPEMRKQKWGRIIFFGFGRAMEAPAWPDRSVYAAAKTGLVSFTKTLAVEEAPFGITVNMVCPGDIVREKKEMRIDEVQMFSDIETPRGRPGSGEDVARVIRFLAEEKSDFVTGNLINVTGGLDVIHPVSKRKLPDQ